MRDPTAAHSETFLGPRPAFRTLTSLHILLFVAAVAWVLMVMGKTEAFMPGFCAAAPSWPASAATLKLIFALNPPSALAISVAVMLLAMMAPLLDRPLTRLRDRSSGPRRWEAMMLFVAGYAGVWMAAGIALEVLALGLRAELPGRYLDLSVCGLTALLWQVSPLKQRCLNECHQGPVLSSVGRAANRGALVYGLSQGAWCVGACWALMLLPLLRHGAHLAAMAAVALFLFAERQDDPAPLGWRLRLPCQSVRLAMDALKINRKREA